MAANQENEGNAATSENKKPANGKPAGEGAASSKGELLRLRLKRILGYAMLGFAPAVAVVAVVVAVIAVVGNQSNRTQMNKDTATIANLSASLAASKGELEKLKAAMLKESVLQNEKLKKQDETVAKIIRNVTPLQVKMKVSPTLDEQLGQPASALVDARTPAPVIAPKPAPKAAPVVAVPHVSDVVKAPAKAKAPVVTHAPNAVVTPPAKPATPHTEKQLSPQAQAMKEAIERYNKK